MATQHSSKSAENKLDHSVGKNAAPDQSSDQSSIPEQGSIPEQTSIPEQNSISEAPKVDLNDTALYFNRELALLEFQRRVLEEAMDERNPLLERFKFLSILGSNVEEFFMVRVAGLKRQIEAGTASAGPDGMTPGEQLTAVRHEVT